MKKLLLVLVVLSLFLVGCVDNSNPTTINGGTTADPGTSTQSGTTLNPSDVTTVAPNPGGDSAINGDAKYLDLIYETDRMWSNGYTYNRNVIQSAPQHLIDGSAEQKVTVKINGAQKELQYLESLYYPVPDQTYDIYLVSGEEGEKVYLDENGDVCYIEGVFTTVNISKTAAPEDVLPLLKEAVKEYADLSYYKNVKMPDDKSQNASGFGSYKFYFYNTADGYRTDWLRVTVNDDGTVKSLRINNLKYSVTSLNIVKSLENKMLDLKVNDMYTTLFTEPESYKLSDRVSEPVEVIIRNGEVYIQYTLCIEYTHIIDGKGEDDYIDIIVPLDIIDADN